MEARNDGLSCEHDKPGIPTAGAPKAVVKRSIVVMDAMLDLNLRLIRASGGRLLCGGQHAIR